MTESLSIKRLSPSFALYALLLLAACGIALWRQTHIMDSYEHAILLITTAGLLWLGYCWRAMQFFLPVCGAFSLLAVARYSGDIANAQKLFLLKYLLSSQSAVLWMCVLFALAMLIYWLGLLRRATGLLGIGSGLTWAAASAALIALLVRWHESWLIGPDVGHIPVSNLYEVFILFCLITALLYLYYEAKYAVRNLGAIVLPIICAAAGFIIWYSLDRQAHSIQPLVPALQSWWMKIHVPANFVGYGAFAIAAMLAIASLLVRRGWLATALPKLELLDELMYRAIAIGFLFFTIATALGAMWAADAWGSYWSWDPKEVWALIVWLNYAAWLHIRLVKGWRGALLAWWALIGLLVTSFAFIGVNLFLSGLHSYGNL